MKQCLRTGSGSAGIFLHSIGATKDREKFRTVFAEVSLLTETFSFFRRIVEL